MTSSTSKYFFYSELENQLLCKTWHFLQVLDWLLDGKGSLTLDGRFLRPKKVKSHVQNMGIFFGGSGYGPEPACQISAYYKFFPGKSYFYRTTRSSVEENFDFSACVLIFHRQRGQ